MEINKIKQVIGCLYPIDSVAYKYDEGKETLFINEKDYRELMNECIDKSIELHNNVMVNLDDDAFMLVVDLIKDDIDLNKLDTLINADKLNLDDTLYLVKNIRIIMRVVSEVINEQLQTLTVLKNEIEDLYE